MVFGELYTSSNYNDNEERLVSGRNGLGSKATSLFSSFFSVKGCDPRNKKLFYQEWYNNMSSSSKPSITKTAIKNGYTEVSWIADFPRFGIEKYSQDIISLFEKYVYDTAMVTKINVFLNDKKINISSLLEYSKLFYHCENSYIYHKGPMFEIVVTPSDNHEVISFVNGNNTSKGGKHVESWSEAIFRPLVNHFNKTKNPYKINIKDVKQFFKLFINVTVVNPEFESQEKCELLHPDVPASFPNKYITAICKWENTKKIQELLKRKDLNLLEKSISAKKKTIAIKGLDKANKSGTKFSSECTLILCEGLSAKTYAVIGIDVGIDGKKGRDWYGIMSLKGKILNVRNKNASHIAKNKEVTDIINALGLKYGVDYTNDKNYLNLNYGKLMILCDSDSVSEDTPLLLRNPEGLMEIRTINDISDNWGEYGEKEISDTNFEVWTHKGWTEIVKVIKHKVTKKMFRILTHTGCVDVTEDHSLFRDNDEKVSPKDCKVGEKLLHSFPFFSNNGNNILPNEFNFENKSSYVKDLNRIDFMELVKYLKIQHYCKKNREQLEIEVEKILKYEYTHLLEKDFGISEEEAYVMGLFWADGTCGIYEWKYKNKPKNRPNEYIFNRVSFNWAIVNMNLDYLNKAQKTLSNTYPYKFKIVKCKNDNKYIYKLLINGGKETEPLVRKYRDLFYDKYKKKKIPVEILNSSRKVREEFYKGFYDGDGNKCKNRYGNICNVFDVDGKIGAQGLYLLCKSIGYQVSFNTSDKKPKVYTLVANKTSFQKNANEIKKDYSFGR